MLGQMLRAEPLKHPAQARKGSLSLTSLLAEPVRASAVGGQVSITNRAFLLPACSAGAFKLLFVWLGPRADAVLHTYDMTYG